MISKCYISKAYKVKYDILDPNRVINILNNLKQVHVYGNKILEVLDQTFPNVPIILVNKAYYKLELLGPTENGLMFAQFLLNSKGEAVTKRFVLTQLI